MWIALAIYAVLITVGVLTKANTWTHRFAVALDICTASIVWSQYDVTISARCGLEMLKGSTGNRFMRALGWLLGRLQTDHCALAVNADRQRAVDALMYLNHT